MPHSGKIDGAPNSSVDGNHPTTADLAESIARSSPRGSDPSDFGDLDPRLADLMEAVTGQLEAGETIDLDQLDSAKHPGTCARPNSPAHPGLQNLAVDWQVDGCRPDRNRRRTEQRPDEGHRVFGDFRIFHGEVGRRWDGHRLRGPSDPTIVKRGVCSESSADGRRGGPPRDPAVPARGPGRRSVAASAYRAGLFGRRRGGCPLLRDAIYRGGSLADLIGELRSGLVDRRRSAQPTIGRRPAVA